MLDSIRYWLSAELLGWSVWLIPDPDVKNLMRRHISNALDQLGYDDD